MDHSASYRMRLASWLRRHPLFGYFTLAFGIPWGGIGVVLVATGFNLAALRPWETGCIFMLMLLGPSAGGLMLTAVLEGHVGLRQLGSRLVRWRVGVGWYAVALLTAPLFLLVLLWSSSVVLAPAFAPHFHWAFLAVGLIAGGFEEIGWTGFATPLLLAPRRPGMAGLLLGLVWALWHGPVVLLLSYKTMGASSILSFAIAYLATLTPYRILMTWVYANTRSVATAVLMHASYTGWLLVLFPTTSPVQSLVWQSAFAVMLWLAAAVVLRGSGPRAAASAAASG